MLRGQAFKGLINDNDSQPQNQEKRQKRRPTTFPAPLVLPGNQIAYDPEYPPQSYQDWLDDEDRNPVTTRRRLYRPSAASIY